jgi:hypothetical protein
VRFVDRLDPAQAKKVLIGYRNERYRSLVDAVTESEPGFDEERLGQIAVVDLLVTPVLDLAATWR